MIKVLHINFSDTGGAAIASMDLHEELVRQEIDSKFLTLNLVKEHSSDFHYYSHRRVYQSLFEKFWFLYVKAFLVNKKVKKLIGVIEKPNEMISFPYACFDITKDPLYVEADVIHLHWVSGFLDWPTFFKKNKKPIVWTLHDKNPFSGILHCTTEFPIKNKKIEENFVQKKRGWLANSNIHVVSPSKKYANFSQKSEVMQNFPHHVIHHGISHNIFYPKSQNECRNNLKLPKNKLVVIAMADDLKRKLKGFYELIKLAEREKELHFVFIGKKDASLPQLENATFVGQVNNRGILNEYYNAADLTISNSKEESFGLTLAESLVAGTCICSLDVGVVPELKSENLCLDINPLAINPRSINSIISDKKSISSTSLKYFSLAKSANKYIDLYKSII